MSLKLIYLLQVFSIIRKLCNTRDELGLRSLEDRRENHRLCLLTQIIQNGDQHRSLSRAYDKITEDRELVAVTAHEAARGELISI